MPSENFTPLMNMDRFQQTARRVREGLAARILSGLEIDDGGGRPCGVTAK